MSFDRNDRLDTLLTRRLRDEHRDDAVSAARVMAALNAAPLPRQKRRLFANWPPFLLRWDFTPAWPRVAALASCAAVGFLVGLAGFDTSFDEASAGVRARADIVSIVSDGDSELLR